METHTRTATVMHFSQFFQIAQRQAARKAQTIETTGTRHFDFQQVGQRIDHRNTHAVQTAGGFIGFAVKFTTRVKLGHNHFKRGFARHLRVVFNRNTASVIADSQEAFSIEININEIGMTGNSFVHRIVDDFGKQMVQCFFVGTTDIHART